MENIHNVSRVNIINVIKLLTEGKIKRFKEQVMPDPNLCSVYLKLLLLAGKSGTISDRMFPCVASVYCLVACHFWTNLLSSKMVYTILKIDLSYMNSNIRLKPNTLSEPIKDDKLELVRMFLPI